MGKQPIGSGQGDLARGLLPWGPVRRCRAGAQPGYFAYARRCVPTNLVRLIETNAWVAARAFVLFGGASAEVPTSHAQGQVPGEFVVMVPLDVLGPHAFPVQHSRSQPRGPHWKTELMQVLFARQ
jgi:hypothetical protein